GPFDKITPAEYEAAKKEGISQHSKEIVAIVENPENPTFENTIVALDRSGKLLTTAVLTLSNLESAMGEPDLMKIMGEMTPLISEHQTGLLLNQKLWERIKKVYDTRDSRKDLSPEAMRLIEETYKSFSRSGANLQGEDRETYKKIMRALSDSTVKFGQNVSNEMSNPALRLWLKEEDLSGLPDAIRSAAREAAKEVLAGEGKEDNGSLYLFTMYSPSYVPFMKYADKRELREKLWRMSNSRNTKGEYDNTGLIKNIVNKRLELARLMGKDNFSQYKLQGTMAATPEAVMNLLEDLRTHYKDAAQDEMKEIEKFAQKSEGPDFKLMPWDYSYWADKLKNEQYAFNDEVMKPYFELQNTIDGVFGLATRLYGYTFKENNAIPIYHPDVKAFEVYDEDGSLLGILYADFFYRTGKSPGAWMTEFRGEEKDNDGKRTLPLISIVCNFSKPVGDEPVLLTPSEVETFLHEFGHALHGLSAQAVYPSFAGTNVYHDFVELFSQFNENYLTEKEFLDGFARHYKTGEKMPAELIEKFVESNRFGAAYACMRQLGFGYLDMAYHTKDKPFEESDDVEAFEVNAQNPVRLFEAINGTSVSPNFGHIFSGGYASGYYGYKWSEVLDADAFAAFKENGIFDKATAEKFKKMLRAGGSVDPMDLYIEFRGKQPTTEAILKRDGIIK
ncbi:MAG: M3 family metallopeptidase, partial [Muribaculaceae bacterium]|nr:M3 family metallopeptidase [Muribaculaceae bacterium]